MKVLLYRPIHPTKFYSISLLQQDLQIDGRELKFLLHKNRLSKRVDEAIQDSCLAQAGNKCFGMQV